MAGQSYRIEAIEDWPHKARERRQAPFRMTFDGTLKLLRKEVGLLGADEDAPILLRLVCEPRHVRKDGMLRQDAWIGHPGVILHADTAAGPLEFATDRYEQWRDNLHAIALSLGALRGVDRWGVTHGAQYAGFKALPAGTTGFGSPEHASEWMVRKTFELDLSQPSTNSLTYRQLARHLHPDTHPEHEAEWRKLQAARSMLAAAGLL